MEPKPPLCPPYLHCSCFSCSLSFIAYYLELATTQYSFIHLLNYIPFSPQDSLFSTLTCSTPLRLPLLDFHRNDHGISSYLLGASPIATLTRLKLTLILFYIYILHLLNSAVAITQMMFCGTASPMNF